MDEGCFADAYFYYFKKYTRLADDDDLEADSFQVYDTHL